MSVTQGQIDLSKDKLQLLETDGHILALGGPGSGKTYIALLKADKVITSGKLQNGQRVLFLSFARATIARVAEQAGKLISKPEKSGLEINTYHGFTWRILQSHGYLINANQRIRLLPPPEAAARLSEIEVASREAEKRRLFEQEGFLHFDLFSQICHELLTRSRALRTVLSDAYPTIILDEFQDTNEDEWRMIQTLGERSVLIALADADQRIYEFRGADPKRIGEFISKYSPAQFDFGLENNRSNGTDIVTFGNDLLTGANKGKTYQNVTVVRYQIRKGVALHLDMKLAVWRRYADLVRSKKSEWSLVILVPTKQLMIEVSDYLSSEQRFGSGKRLSAFPHEVAMDTEGPALAAVLIGGLLEAGDAADQTAERLILDLCEHIRGRKGSDVISRSQLELAGALREYVESGVLRGSKRKALVSECSRIAQNRISSQLSGDPGQDWLTVRRDFEEASSEVLKQVAEDARYLRLLNRGAQLRGKLGELWRTTGGYQGAAAAVRDALLQEHFLRFHQSVARYPRDDNPQVEGKGVR